jgi:hypothetical protein
VYYLLANRTAILSAIGVVGVIGVNWDDKVWKLPVDEHAQRWQTEEDGEKSQCMHVGRWNRSRCCGSFAEKCWEGSCGSIARYLYLCSKCGSKYNTTNGERSGYGYHDVTSLAENPVRLDESLYRSHCLVILRLVPGIVSVWIQ